MTTIERAFFVLMLLLPSILQDVPLAFNLSKAHFSYKNSPLKTHFSYKTEGLKIHFSEKQVFLAA